MQNSYTCTLTGQQLQLHIYSGTKHWYRNDQLHREDGPAVEYANGDKFWFRNNQRHREDGPAIEFANGHKSWYRNDQLHREDGPAVEFTNGYKEYWIKGQKLTNLPTKKLTTQVGYGIKCISSASIEMNLSAGFGGWIKTDKGLETWCMTYPFPILDINAAHKSHQQWDNHAQYSYYVEEVPIGTPTEK